jgi:short-subunit dehydrogenase
MTKAAINLKNIVIIGATSAVAQATARQLVAPHARFVLVGRNPDKLRHVQKDLRARGAAQATVLIHDVVAYEKNKRLIPRILQEMGTIDLVLMAHGSLGDQRQCAQHFEEAHEELAVNLLSPISLLIPFAGYFAEKKCGTIVVISSVAGDRGRQSNYTYGCAKGGLSLYLQGLRNRLHPHGVRVLTLKLGYVDSPMTAHLPSSPLMVSPERAACGLMRALKGRRDVAYIPWFWQGIMLVIVSIPERLFKRLKL